MAENKYYKHPKYGHVYGVNTPTPIGRIVWVSLVEPKLGKVTDQNPNPTAKYQVTFLFPKTNEAVKAFLASTKKQADEIVAIFNKGRPTQLSVTSIFKDGDNYDHEKYPYYKDNWVLPASNPKPVAIVNQQKTPIEAKTILGGMLCRGVVVPLCTAAGGITYRLEMLQLAKDDGVRYGGGRPDPGSFLDAISGDAPNEGAEDKTAEKEKSARQTALNLL